jgi:hypothetical protein
VNTRTSIAKRLFGTTCVLATCLGASTAVAPDAAAKSTCDLHGRWKLTVVAQKGGKVCFKDAKQWKDEFTVVERGHVYSLQAIRALNPEQISLYVDTTGGTCSLKASIGFQTGVGSPGDFARMSYDLVVDEKGSVGGTGTYEDLHSDDYDKPFPRRRALCNQKLIVTGRKTPR